MAKDISGILNQCMIAKDIIKNTTSKLRVISHYDADGICSAAIAFRMLLREGKDFHLSMVKQLSERIVEEISAEENDVYIFTDLGSGQIKAINQFLTKSSVIICDHHEPQGEAKENVIHINSRLFGMEDEISGAGITYLLARTVNPANVDLSHLAIIGAIGDSQIDSIGSSWGLNGLNREILKTAEAHNLIRVSKGLRLWGRYSRPVHKALEYSMDPYIPGVTGSESAAVQLLQEIGINPKRPDGRWKSIADLSIDEQRRLADEIIKERIRGNHENPEHIFGDVYELLDKPEEFRDANEFATTLNACGKMGKAWLGVFACLNIGNAFHEVREVVDAYRKEVGKGVSFITSNLNRPDIVLVKGGVYIFAGNRISEHLISNVISILNHSGMLPSKPLFGFADSEEGVKISARVPRSLEGKIDIQALISEVAKELGGEGGGHAMAAGATIPKGLETKFVELMEERIGQIQNQKAY